MQTPQQLYIDNELLVEDKPIHAAFIWSGVQSEPLLFNTHPQNLYKIMKVFAKEYLHSYWDVKLKDDCMYDKVQSGVQFIKSCPIH